jgi:glutamate racemase
MKIGVFDSGYGGLTILEKIRERLPQYDYLYLGDNARAPYGTRSFEVIYEYTLQAVRWLESQGCRLIILACNTASAKALRTIQQHDINPDKLRVLGVVRPTVEAVPALTQTGHVGILATPATVSSESYLLELAKLKNPQLIVTQQACPMWVPLIESGEHFSAGAEFFVNKYLCELFAKDAQIDTLVLGCTHYPLLLDKIMEWLNCRGTCVSVISQGLIVADSLADYLSRHADIEQALSQNGTCTYITTESADKFRDSASMFLSKPVEVRHIEF